MTEGQTQMVFFQIGEQGYAIRVDLLAGVGIGCPVVAYPGLPHGVRAVVEWSGKIFPVLGSEKMQNQSLEKATFLFFKLPPALKSSYDEAAIAVTGGIRVFVPVESRSARRVESAAFVPGFVGVHELYDSSGRRAIELFPAGEPQELRRAA